MNRATRVTVAAFGVVAAMAGLEHGIGEIWQGNVAPQGIVIESWAGSALFEILAGEPAMTLIPNLLASGILTVFLSLLFLVWVVWFAPRRYGWLGLMGLSLALLLVGGGFGPPLLGLILGLVATRINAPLVWWQRLPAGLRTALDNLWPWFLGAGLLAWLFLFPGVIIVNALVDMANPEVMVMAAAPAAFGLLALTVAAALARDVERDWRLGNWRLEIGD